MIIFSTMALAGCGSGPPSRVASSGGANSQGAGSTVNLTKTTLATASLRAQAEQRQEALNAAVDLASAKVSNDENRLQLDVTLLTRDDAGLTGNVLAAGGTVPQFWAARGARFDVCGTDLDVHAAGNTVLEVQAAPCTDLGTLISDYNQVYEDTASDNGNACRDAAVVGSEDPSAIGGDEYTLRLATVGGPSIGEGVINEDASLDGSDEQAAKNDLAALASDWRALGHSVAADPAYPPFDGTLYNTASYITARMSARNAIADLRSTSL